MFGRRARERKAEQEALKRMMEEAEANRRAQLEQERQQQEAKVYYDSEIIFDEPEDAGNNFDVQNDVPNNEPTIEDTPAPVIVALPVPEEEKKEEPVVETPAVKEAAIEPAAEPVIEPAAEPVVEPAVEPVIDAEPVKDEEPEEELAEESTAEHEGDEEPEIRYVVDGPTEDDELVKPAKLVKLPNLVDYMLSLKMSKRMKINVATLLIGAYSKFKDIPEEKAIIVGCMKKVMFALVNEK